MTGLYKPHGIAVDGSGNVYVAGAWSDNAFKIGCSSSDADCDGSTDGGDNCPAKSNPDQLNSDCQNPPSDPGCNDGDDVCDVCPALDDNDKCDASRSGGKSIGLNGGTFDTPDGSITVSVPLGAVDADTSLTVTDSVPGFFLDPTGAAAPLYKVGLRPEDQHFAVPVTITFRWDDRDNDGRVDRETCQGGANAGLTCDENADCPGSTCSRTAAPNEDSLLLKRNGTKFSKDGFLGTAPFECQDHLAGSGCETAVANCADAPGTGMATVANCCDTTSNEWTFQTCDFSEFLLGENFADLIPGNGSPTTDCVAEWTVNNPQNDPFLDKKGLPNFKQTCTDGDVLCDFDGTMNRQCVFEVGVCLNVPDERLVNKGEVACTPVDVEVWELKKPKPDSKKQLDADNGEALRDAVLGLGTGTVSGKHQEQITFTPSVSLEDTCTNLVQVAVPLKGKDLDRQGRVTIRMKSTTPSGMADMDKLKLTCLPGSPSHAFLDTAVGLLD